MLLGVILEQGTCPIWLKGAENKDKTEIGEDAGNNQVIIL